jgi:hypothetical protein
VYVEAFLARITENSSAGLQTAVKTVDVFEGMPCGALPSASELYCNEVSTVWLLDTVTNLTMTCMLKAKVSEHIFNLSSNTGSHYGEPVHGLVTLYSGPVHVKLQSVLIFMRHPVP